MGVRTLIEASRSRSILLLGLTLCAATSVFALAYIVGLRENIAHRIEAEQGLVARTMERHVTETFDGVATILGNIAEEGSDTRIGIALQRAIERAPYLRSISLADSNGRILASSNPANLGRTIDWAIAFPAAPTERSLLIGRAQFGHDLVESNATGASAIQRSSHFIFAAQRITDVNGTARFLIAAVHPGALVNPFESASNDSSLRVAVVSTEGELLAGSAALKLEPRRLLKHMPVFNQPAGGLSSGPYQGAGLDNEESVGTYRQSSRFPLIVVVDQHATGILDRTWTEARAPANAMILAAVFFAVLALLASRALRRREHLQSEYDIVIRGLRESEQRRRSIQEAAPDAIVCFDNEHRIVELNQAAERLFGWSRLDAVGQNLFDRIIPDETRPAFVEAMRRFQATGQAAHLGGRLELTLRRSGAEPMPAESVLTRIDTASSVLFTLHIRDLRQQKEASAALRSSEQRHRVVLDSVREVIFQTDRDGAFTYLNLAWRRMTRLQVDETLGRRVWEFVAERDRPQVQRLFEILAGAGTDATPPEPIEVTLMTNEGGTRLLHISVQALRDADGHVHGAVGTLDDITEKRAVEIRLREQLRLSQELLEAIPLPVALKDSNGAFQAVNRAWETFTGRHRADMLEKTLFDVMPKDLAERFVQAEQNLISIGGTGMIDGILRRADGSMRNVLNYSTVFTRDDGVASGTISTLVDITEQKASEEEARRANRELQDQLRFSTDLLEVVPMPIAFRGEDQRFIAVNRAWEEFSGRNRDAVIGRTAADIFPPDVAGRIATLDQALIDSDSLQSYEASVQNPAGETRIALTRKAILRRADGSVHGIIGTFTDITEQKAAEKALQHAKEVAEAANRESQKQLNFTQSLLEAIPVPVTSKDAGGRLTAVNRAWEHFFQQPREAILGHSGDAIMLAPEDVIRLRDAESLITRTGGSVALEAERTLKDGTKRHLRYYKTAVQNAEGGLDALITTAVDLTAEKTAESAARKAKDAAEAANRAKNEFLASISHELRTPLTGIMGMAGLALESELKPEPREYIELVRSSADTLLYIIDDMHDFARIEAGELAIERTTFNPRALVGEVMRMMAMRAHDKGLELVIDLESDVPAALQGDANRLRQILVNLTNNAIKYTEQGEVELKVAVAQHSDRTVELHFTLRDTGPGIAPERRERLLAAIGDSTDSTDVHKQSGALGLAITARLIRLMGGDGLAIDSAEGDGTSFSFTLPLATHPAGMVDAPGGAMAGRLLIVDGNARARNGTAKVLARLGVNTSSAALGMHVEMWLNTAMHEGEPFDWALIDANMGTDESLAIARDIASRSPDTRIVFMLTVAGKGSNPTPFREASYTHFVRKPLLEHDLARVLSNVNTEIVATKPEGAQAAANEPEHLGSSILVAEDNMVNQALVRRLLQSAGYTVTIVANGRMAVEAVELGRFDLILMDVQMPEMGGIEATRRIREMEANGLTRTPIVALTAHAFGRDRELCLAAGMDGHLAKPVKPAALHEVLSAYLGTRPSPSNTSNTTEKA